MLLSVIVPVFNGEKYLKECLMSLVDQVQGDVLTAANYEIIVVNDGSTDGTECVIDEFCEQYSFVKKINKQNSGVSATRNLGIKMAKGEYITFLDADDMVVTNIYPSILECMMENGLEGYSFGVFRDYIDQDYNTDVSIIKRETNIGRPDGFWGVHGSIYKKRILSENNILFDITMSYQEDLLFNFYYLQCIQRIGKTELPLYIYRKNEESVTSAFFNKKTAYGDMCAKEYRCYLSKIKFLKSIKEYQRKKPEDLLCENLLSVMTSELLWFAMKSLYSPKKVLNDIKNNGLSLNDIKIKHQADTKGNRIKVKFLRYLKCCFKVPVFYTLFCKIYNLKK